MRRYVFAGHVYVSFLDFLWIVARFHISTPSGFPGRSAEILPPFFSSGFLLEMKEEERRKVWKKELKNDGGDAAKYKVKFEGAG